MADLLTLWWFSQICCFFLLLLRFELKRSQQLRINIQNINTTVRAEPAGFEAFLACPITTHPYDPASLTSFHRVHRNHLSSLAQFDAISGYCKRYKQAFACL